jgi:hypothetical protein
MIVLASVRIVRGLLRRTCENLEEDASPTKFHQLTTIPFLPPCDVFIAEYRGRHEVAMELDFVDERLDQLICNS